MKKILLLLTTVLLSSCNSDISNSSSSSLSKSENEINYPSRLQNLNFPSSFIINDKTYRDSGVFDIVYDITLEGYLYHPDNIKKEEYDKYKNYVLVSCKELSYHIDSYICPIYSVKENDNLYVGLEYFRVFNLVK